MRKIKIYIVMLVTALVVHQAKAQGCMGGGGDLIGVSGFIQPQYNFNLNGTDGNGNSLNTNNFPVTIAGVVMRILPLQLQSFGHRRHFQLA